jgi:hypothetical protein
MDKRPGLRLVLGELIEAHTDSGNALYTLVDAINRDTTEGTIKACLEIIVQRNQRAADAARRMAKLAAEHLNRHARVA